MKSAISFILSSIIFLASFQNSLFYVDYQINTEFYETYCINKQKPELETCGSWHNFLGRRGIKEDNGGNG